MAYSSELCRRRLIKKLDKATPVLVPSFSSKGFPDLGQVWKDTHSYISEAALISCYDIYYGHITPFEGPDILFLDSGGYETLTTTDLEEEYGLEYHPREWDRQKHGVVLKRLSSLSTTVIISYDSLDSAFEHQISQAKETFNQYPSAAADFLVKPVNTPYIDPILMAPVMGGIEGIDLLGVTEKELGNSLIARLKTLIKLRQLLSDNGLDTPIHIFGCFDPLSIWLYFLCGADVFDGLSWLRYSFLSDVPIYRNAWPILTGQLDLTDTDLRTLSWLQNLEILKKQQQIMRHCLAAGDIMVSLPKRELLIPILEQVGVVLQQKE
jgi:hypothetical protein